MTRLYWNFAQRRGWTQPCSIVSIVAVAGCIHALWWRHDLLQRQDHVVAQVQEAFRRAAAREHQISSPPPVALNQVFAEMRYPWTDVLDSLQRVTKPSLELLTLEPDTDVIQRVHISGVATQAQDVFDLIAALQGDHSWSSVRLISQTRSNDSGMPPANGSALPGLSTAFPRSISFSLVAEWGRQ